MNFKKLVLCFFEFKANDINNDNSTKKEAKNRIILNHAFLKYYTSASTN